MSLIKAMATVAGLTGVSRIAGFTRDILTATFLGAGPVADAFFVALKLPNFFRRVTAEGAFSVSFVPLYSEALAKEGEESAGEFAGQAFTMMLWVLSFFTVVVIAAMPWVIYAIAPGFGDDPERYGLAVEMSRVTFPYLLLMSLTALMGGILNAHDRFAPFAAAPIFFNLTLITFLLLSTVAFETAGHALAYGVLTAGFVQFGLLWFFVKRYGVKMKIKVRPHATKRIKKLFRLMGPGVIGAGVMHINLFADVIIASMLETGSISYLYYADRLNQLPLGLVGIAVGTALLPMLSRAIASGDTKESNALFNRALEICFLMALPAATGLFLISLPIVMALFQHGAFDLQASIMTTLVVTTYALGLPAYIAGKVYSTAYWATQDTLTPVKASVVATLFNIGLSLWLVFEAGAGVAGIATATAMAGWLQLLLLSRGVKGRAETKLDSRFKRNIVKIFFCCVAMAVFLLVTKGILAHWYIGPLASTLTRIMGVIVLVGGGAIVYAGAIMISGVINPRELKRYLKRSQ